MRRIVYLGFMVLAVLAGAAAVQQQPAQAKMDGPRGEMIVWVAQIELARAGLYEGPYHGTLTVETREAVEDFEHRVGWPESGRVTPDLIIAIKRYNLVVIADSEDF